MGLGSFISANNNDEAHDKDVVTAEPGRGHESPDTLKALDFSRHAVSKLHRPQDTRGITYPSQSHRRPAGNSLYKIEI